MQTIQLPKACGIGLRAPHMAEVVREQPDVAWFEVHSENFFAAGGAQLQQLLHIRQNYPISLHGVGLSLGSTDPLDREHLAKLKDLVQRLEPSAVSEHVCWSGVGAVCFNDLLPLPYSRQALAHLCERVQQVQEFLGRTILMENVSSYLQFKPQEMPEWEFCRLLAQRTGCQLVLDVNNVYVSACNHGFEALEFIHALAPESVGEIHLAGHECHHGLLIDTHSRPVCEAVWALYAQTLQRLGVRATLIEWDQDIPALSVLRREAARAQTVLNKSVQGGAHVCPA